MKSFFVPFSSGEPATISVNGHRLVLLSRSSRLISESLPHLGADSIRRLRCSKTRAAEERLLQRVSSWAKAGIVIAPKGVELASVIENLESELPWIQ